MKNIRNKSLLFAGLAATAACIMFAVSATGGNLEPASPPAPTMHTLDEIYNMAGSVGMPVWPMGAAKSRSMAYVQFTPAVLGEANEASHNNWIETLSVSYMMSVPSGTAAGTDKGSKTGTKVSFTELYFVKEIDRATPTLAKGCANGKRYNTVVIDFTRTIAGSRKIYLKMTLSDVTISSIMSVMSPRAQNDFTHLEQVSLRYSKIEWLYSRYNESTGALIDTTQEHWDVAKNKDY